MYCKQKSIDNSGISVIKGEGVIKAPPAKLRELLSSVEQRGKWDTFFDSGKIVKQLKEVTTNCAREVFIIHTMDDCASFVTAFLISIIALIRIICTVVNCYMYVTLSYYCRMSLLFTIRRNHQ